MNKLPISPVSHEEQQLLMSRMYALLAKQVKSYHKNNHMGDNTSVPVELAQELMESIDYTLSMVGGAHAGKDLEEALCIGQEILQCRVRKAKDLVALVAATAPNWQTECRVSAIRYLSHYLDTYDCVHLAHRGPDDLFYPILISPPEGLRGIERCIFYLNILWIENQIMAGVSDTALEQLWDRLPPETLNQCEQVLINGIGKALLGVGLDPLVFSPDEYIRVMYALLNTNEEQLKKAAELLCSWLDLKDEAALSYAGSVTSLFLPWIDGSIDVGNIRNLFL